MLILEEDPGEPLLVLRSQVMKVRPSLPDVALGAVGVFVLGWVVLGAGGQERLQVTVLAVALAVALVLARRWPIPAVGVSLAGMIFTDGAADAVQSAFLFALIVSCFVAGRYGPLVQLPWVGAGVLLLVSGTLLDPESGGVADAVFPVLFTAGPCLLGLAIQLGARRERLVRDQARLLETMRAEEVRRAAVEERLRIARDLHDLVAHDISAVSLQAQVARRGVQAGRPVEAETLLRIEKTARNAMNDARRLLGLLTDYEDDGASPTPSLNELDGLIERARAAGQPVELDQSGQPRRLPPALSQAAYRVVQESLTNARRHGAEGSTRVHLTWKSNGLDIRVTNPAHSGAHALPGHGLNGITQRAEMFGGNAHAGPLRDTWEVRVHLPVPGQVTS